MGWQDAPVAGGKWQQAPEADSGALAANVTGAVNGFTAGLLPKMGAVVDSLGLTKGRPNIFRGSSFGKAFSANNKQNVDQIRRMESQHPSAMASEVGGAIFSPVNKLAKPLQAIGATGKIARGLIAAAPDAAYGLLYGAGQSKGNVAHDALTGAASSAAGGFAGRALIGAGSRIIAPKLARGVISNAPKSYKAATQLLAKEGVDIMPGQAIGPRMKSVEEKAMSLPLTGDAIRHRVGQQSVQFVNAGLNRALKPLGSAVPKGKAGTDAFAHAQGVFDKTYEKARAGMVFQSTPKFGTDVADVMERAQNSPLLSSDHVKRLQNVVKDLQTRRIAADGTMTGDTLKRTLSSLKSDASKLRGGNNSADNQALGDFMDEIVDHIDEAARTNPASDPKAVALMDKADQGYAIMVRLENAAKMRGGDTGMFSPAQLDAAVQRGDKTVRNRAYLRGDALLQDLADAGKQVLAPKVPNSGTFDRAAMGRMALGAGTVGAGAAFSPGSLAAAGAASTPYLIPGLLTKRPDALLKAGQAIGQRKYLGGLLGAPLAAQIAAINNQ